MKTLKVFLISAIILAGFSSNAQRKTGFGAPSVSYTTINGNNVWEAGGLGGYHFTPSLYIGGAGYGSSYDSPNNSTSMGYGGLVIGYVIAPSKTLHINTRILSAIGGAEVVQDGVTYGDKIGVFRLTVEAEVLTTSWMQVGLGGGYRFVADAELGDISSKDLSSHFISATVRFGEFR